MAELNVLAFLDGFMSLEEAALQNQTLASLNVRAVSESF
jgi:hypothetical protein